MMHLSSRGLWRCILRPNRPLAYRPSGAGILLGALTLLPLLASPGSCTAPSTPALGSERIVRVVAAENFWGSIAAQLGGAHAAVTSIVADPNIDPHEYEATTHDARAFAKANYVILNGAGYDEWGQKLLDANPIQGRGVLTVATLLGESRGENPHFWYHPDFVRRVADRIAADYAALDPVDEGYFAERRAAFEQALQTYRELIAAIGAKYAGTPIGATEDIFVFMADALGLPVISPPAYMRAAAASTDPPAAAVAQFQRQIDDEQIVVLVYNVQASSTITANLAQAARERHIPVIGITETMQPPGSTFQGWQCAQLQALESALAARAVSRSERP